MAGPVDPYVKQVMTKNLGAFDRAMKKVASKAVNQLKEQMTYDNMLHEAVVTRTVSAPQTYLNEQVSNNMPNKPATGMAIGNFAVFTVPNANGKARYDVADMTTGNKLVGGLHLAEGANAIVKLLNRQYSFYSPQIKQILEYENNYVKHYQDAVQFQRKVKSSPRDMILETRFDEAKRSAQIVKEKLEQYVKTI